MKDSAGNELLTGDTVVVTNHDLMSEGALGVIEHLGAPNTVKVNFSKVPQYYSGNWRIHLSNRSVTLVEPKTKPLKEAHPMKSKLAIFFSLSSDFSSFLANGAMYSMTSEFDVVAVDNLDDCAEWYNKQDSGEVEDIECLYFDGEVYDIKQRVSFIKSEDY